jgi:AcrR family transcriptional regulator
MMRAVNEETGRVNQKLRTRMAIVEACREVIRSGGPVTMPAVARAALVSEPTAYRYFPDLTSLLNAALVGMWPSPAEALEPIATSADPVERIAFAGEFFLRRVLSYQGAVRAMISATITRPELAAHRPGIRFGLIDQALDPIAGALPLPPEQLAQLKHDLAAVISAEALFSLTDLCRLTPDDAVASLVRTATTITANATRDDGPGPSQPGKRRSPRR